MWKNEARTSTTSASVNKSPPEFAAEKNGGDRDKAQRGALRGFFSLAKMAAAAELTAQQLLELKQELADVQAEIATVSDRLRVLRTHESEVQMRVNFAEHEVRHEAVHCSSARPALSNPSNRSVIIL